MASMSDTGEGSARDQLNVPLSADLKILANSLAKRRNKSLAAIIRELLQQQIDGEFDHATQRELIQLAKREESLLSSPKDHTKRQGTKQGAK